MFSTEFGTFMYRKNYEATFNKAVSELTKQGILVFMSFRA
jgi:hypothetical protein